MSVPNHASVVQQVYQSGHYDLTTKIGTGTFTEEVARALNAVDPNWGHLKKPNHLGGANHWQHHAVDAVLYRDPAPGRSTAVDIVIAGESSSGAVGWSLDQPRYNPEDWLHPSAVSRFVLPPHHCRLGASFFWFFGAWHRQRHGEASFREKIDRNADALKSQLTADVARVFPTVGGRVDPATGQDPWGLIGSFFSWPDWDETIATGIEYLFGKFGLRSAPTLVGEGAQFRSTDHVLQMVERYTAILRTRQAMVAFTEMWNERAVTGGGDAIVQRMAQRFAELLPGAPFALDTPTLAMGGLHEGNLQPLWDEVTRLYGPTAARVITPQWNRSEPNPLDLGPSARGLRHVHMEPRGPDASAGGNVHDPLPLTHDYIQAAIASQVHGAGPVDYDYHVFHAEPLVWGGCANTAYVRQNRYANVYDLPNWAGIASSLASVRAGTLPDVGPSPEPPVPPDGHEVPMKPQNQFFEEFTQINAFYEAEIGLKRPGGMIFPDPRADVEAMGQWGYQLMAGATVDQVKHQICQSQEWRDKHPGETPPF